MTREKRSQTTAFQNAIAEIVDQFLRDGLSVETIKEVLQDEMSADLDERREEIWATEGRPVPPHGSGP